MDTGTVTVIVVLGILYFVFPIIAAVAAFRKGRRGWGIATLVTIPFGAGWIVGTVALILPAKFPEAEPKLKKLTQADSEKLPSEELSHEAWEKAIAAADAGQDTGALEYFQRAIEMNPDYYVSVIQPASSRAKACWKRAVDEYISRKDAKAQANRAVENHCVVCGKDLRTQWHYFMLESLSMGATVGAQCPECNRTVCKDHIKFESDGYTPCPCPNCGAMIVEMQEGPAYSSMVETARSERRYRGIIKEPASLGRPVIREQLSDTHTPSTAEFTTSCDHCYEEFDLKSAETEPSDGIGHWIICPHCGKQNFSLRHNFHTDCPYWKNRRCFHDPTCLEYCSLATEQTFTTCALL